jgi:hypothetical protein
MQLKVRGTGGDQQRRSGIGLDQRRDPSRAQPRQMLIAKVATILGGVLGLCDPEGSAGDLPAPTGEITAIAKTPSTRW